MLSEKRVSYLLAIARFGDFDLDPSIKLSSFRNAKQSDDMDLESAGLGREQNIFMNKVDDSQIKLTVAVYCERKTAVSVKLDRSEKPFPSECINGFLYGESLNQC